MDIWNGFMRRSDSSTEISLGKGSQDGLGNVLEKCSGLFQGLVWGKDGSMIWGLVQWMIQLMVWCLT